MHSHTNHSRESLEFIQRICECSVLGQSLLSTQAKIAERRGIQVDLCRAFWIPPLSARAAFDCERRQIEQLGLDPLVSITDHEDIEAPMLLNAIPETCGIPISLEWAVPFLGSTFHIGLHNMPVGRARQICQELLAWTAEPSHHQLRELLHSLHLNSSVLIVLNHPLWNLSQTSPEAFREDLKSFLEQCGSYIHAFELNGLRSWKENTEVMTLAARWKQVVISGGDRHGTEPNANINLTNAESFSEWVEEIREQRCSRILFLPQYEEPRVLRLYHVFLDAIREYPSHADGLRRWDERTFHPDTRGTLRPVASLWSEPPKFLQLILGAATITEGSLLRGIRSLGTRNVAKLPGVAEGA